MHIREHLRTVGRHRRLVRHYCLRLGLVWQGLTHDLSKYSPTVLAQRQILPGIPQSQRPGAPGKRREPVVAAS